MATETPAERTARLKREAAARVERDKALREKIAAENAKTEGVQKETQRAAAEFKPDSYKKGGNVKKYARGGGIESKGKTKGRFV